MILYVFPQIPVITVEHQTDCKLPQLWLFSLTDLSEANVFLRTGTLLFDKSSSHYHLLSLYYQFLFLNSSVNLLHVVSLESNSTVDII